MRLARTVAVLTLASGILAGCGGGSTSTQSQQQTAPPTMTPGTSSPTPTDTPTPSAAASADASPSDSPSPSKSAAARISTAEAKKLTTAAVLVAKDMSGFTGAAQPHSASDDTDEHAMYSCLGLPAADYLHRDYGTAFTQGNLEIDSSADVVASVSEATHEAEALKSEKGVNCVDKQMKKSLAKTGATITKLTVTLVSAPVAGADRTWAYHMVADATGPGGSVAVDSYLIGIQVGRTEISLSDTQVNGSASLDPIEKLAATVVSRVKAA